MNKLSRSIFFIAFSLGLFTTSAHTKEPLPIPILIYSEHISAAKELLADQNCMEFDQYEFRNQVLMELVLLCQALSLGGIEPEFKLTPVPSQDRALRLLQTDNYFTAAFTFWNKDANPQFHVISKALIKNGEFFKGIYTSPKNMRLLQLKDPDELKQFKSVSNPSWHVDREVLNCLGVEYDIVVSYPQMLRMVEARRVDFILHNFANHPKLHQHAFGTILKPVEGIKVAMRGSLHFVISKNYDIKHNLYSTLEKGLSELEKRNTIRRAYNDSAFFRHEVSDWKAIGCN